MIVRSSFRCSHETVAAVLWTVLVLAGGSAHAAGDVDWPQWGGPDQTFAVETERALGLDQATTITIAWQRVLGSGYSSVVIADGLAIVAASQDDGDYLLAFDAISGTPRWRTRLASVFLGRSGSDDGPLATPAVTEDRVVMVTPGGSVVAAGLDDGNLLWRVDLVATLDAKVPRYGFSTAPLVIGHRVVVPVGASDRATIAALDTRDGRVLWTAGTDRLGYQNAKRLRLRGVDQVVISGNRHLWGIEPSSGEVLWRHALPTAEDTGLVIPVDNARFLYTGSNDQTFMVVLDHDAEGFAARIEWQQPVFKNNHGIPIHHRGYLYGFDGRFLTSVRVSDGTVAWRSRPPGGKVLTLVDDQLFIWAADGAVVAVAATPDGYREMGRLPLTDTGRAYTPMSYGAGLLFARDLENLYALRLGSTEQPPTRASDLARFGDDRIGTALRDMVAMPEDRRTAAVDRFWASHPTMPIVESSGRVHFLFRGDGDDVALQGDMTGRWPEVAMNRVPGTDLFHRAYELPDGHRWEYRFTRFESEMVDPRNPHTVDSPDGPFSVVQRGVWPTPRPLDPSALRGRLVRHELPNSQDAEQPFALRVYVPPTYDMDRRRYPLVVFSHGGQAMEFGRVIDILDQGSGVEFAPVVVALLALPEWMWWDQHRPALYALLDSQLWPMLQQSYRLQAGPGTSALVAHEWRAENAVRFALAHPARVGKLGLQSPFFTPKFLERAVAPALPRRPDLALYVDHGTFDVVNPNWPVDVASSVAALDALFRHTGNPREVRTRPGGYGWEGWRTHIGTMLGALFPPEEK